MQMADFLFLQVNFVIVIIVCIRYKYINCFNPSRLCHVRLAIIEFDSSSCIEIEIIGFVKSEAAGLTL